MIYNTMNTNARLSHLEYKLFQYFCRLDKQLAHTDQKKILLNVLVSGGKDSMCLMQSIHAVLSSKIFARRTKAKFFLIVTHFNHKKRGQESDEDELFVADQCLKLGIEFFSYDIINSQKNFQNFARQQRKKFSLDVCLKLKATQKYDSFFILTAHHRLDHAESVLLHLIRGSGLQGLQGFINENHSNKITANLSCFLKPFLNISSDEILEYIKHKSIAFREDSSNFEDHYTRNFIRQHILPKFKEINRNFDQNILQFSKIITSLNQNHSFNYAEDTDFLFSESTQSHDVYQYLTQYYFHFDNNGCQNSEISANVINNILHEVKIFKKSDLIEKKIPLKKNRTLFLKKKNGNKEQISASIC